VAAASEAELDGPPLDIGLCGLFNAGVHNHPVIETQSADCLSGVFGALADPTRRAILERLASGEATVGELRAPFAISQPAISKHLKVLESAGLVSRHRRGTANLSRLEPGVLLQADAWLERYHTAWLERFERLDGVLGELQSSPDHRPDLRQEE
jgi:DNA-binding transcriptional ArsR family regulator